MNVWTDQHPRPAVPNSARHPRSSAQDSAAVLANDDEIKAALKDKTEQALQRGVFGAPSMFVDNQLFFGQERLDFVLEALS